jgi:hypothetical protein
MAPLAVAATVLAPPPARRQPDASGIGLAAWGVALVACAAAVALNSPLAEALDLPHQDAWAFLGFWAEGGSVLAVLGMAFRKPPVAWSGAGAFFAFSLALARSVWPGHLVSLALLAAVAAWNLRLRALEPPRPRGWTPLPS